MKKIGGIFLCILLLITCIPVSGTFVNQHTSDATSVSDPEGIIYGSVDGGWVEKRDGVTILHVSGSHYDMGYQHGVLLKEQIQQNIRAFLSFEEEFGWSYDDVLEVWNIQQAYLPQEYKDELEGMADGTGLSYEEIGVHNTWTGVFNHLFYCWGAAAWGDATSDGDLVHTRSADGCLTVHDPVTEYTINENSVIIVRDPINGYASVCPTFAGDVVSIGGFNENAVGVSELTIVCGDTTYHGINGGFRMRMVLDHAATGYEALDIMNSNRGCGWNFIVSDGNIPMGFAIEQTANMVYTGTWFHPVESTPPFWQIKDVVRRGNCFINPLLAATERDRYDSSGFRGFLLFILGQNSNFVVWTLYKSISNEIEQRYGTLDVNTSMSLLRDVYLGSTDLLYRIVVTRYSKTGHQWVGCPRTGDIVVSFADKEQEAFENPVHYFNLFELLESEPP